MIDLLLIHPGAQHGIYGALGDELTALEPPTIARMVLSYVLDRNFSGDILDAEAERLSSEEVILRVGALAPRLVAIVVSGHQPSASTQQMVGASAIAKAIKARLPNQKIVMLGNHPSALPERTLREEAIDYVIDGEGPVSLVALLNALGQVSDIAAAFMIGEVPGLVYRQGGLLEPDKIIRNPLAPLIEDLDRDLHGDVWDLLPMDRYRAHQWQVLGTPDARQPYASIYTTLGCPYKCSFCMINTAFHGNKYRRFSPKRVVNQIESLYARYGIRTFKIADEMFILNEDHYTEICKLLIASGITDDFNIWAYARVDTVKPKTLNLLRRAGFKWLALGIESGSAHVRDGASKRLRTNDIVGTVRTIHDHDINVIGNFIFGLRDDTMETMQQTLNLALECRPDWANFYSCMAYPGSALYTQALAEGWTLPASWRGFSQHNDDCRPLDTEHISGAEVLRFRDAAFRVFFSDATYRAHVARRFGAAGIAEIDRMLEYKLTRKLLTGEIK